MSTGVDGLVSGLKTTDLINSLISVEAVPQTLLKNKASATASMVTALQSLNSQIASLATLATTSSQPTALQLYTASSSSSALTATATTDAGTGSIDLVVGQLAQAQVGVTAAMPSWPTDPAVLTIVSGTGSPIEVVPASSSLDDIVDAINHAGAGVTAMKVASGSIAGVPQYRLQFSSATTGAAAAFSIYQGAAADISAANDLLAQPGSAVIHAAQDAEVTLWAGTTAAQTITSASNNFAELMPGVSVTVSAVSNDPVTLTIARDTAGASKVASDFVDSLNGVFATIAVKSAVTNSTAADGTPAVSGGPFTGDSNVRDAKDTLLAAASMPVNGISPSEIGISITKT
ncbi:MAG: flagellar filament capping protein FliD, partial [Lacisediminihabitans sp.]